MKVYVIYCRDRSRTENPQKKVNPAHPRHVEDYLDQHLVAGPVKDALSPWSFPAVVWRFIEIGSSMSRSGAIRQTP